MKKTVLTVVFLCFVSLHSAIVDLNAPIEGFVEQVFVQEGDSVETDSLLIRLVNPQDSAKFVELKQLIDQKQNELFLLHEQIKEGESLFVEANTQQLRVFMQKKEVFENDINALNEDLARKEHLFEIGLVDKCAVESATERLRSKVSALVDLEFLIAEIKAGPRFEEIERCQFEINALQDELNTIEERLDKQSLYAPSEGHIKTVYRFSGERVQEGDPLLQIEF